MPPPRPRLQLSPNSNQWIRSTKPLRLFYRPPIPSPQPVTFPTLASAPAGTSLQAPQDVGGVRIAQAGPEGVVSTGEEKSGDRKGKGKRIVWGVEVPEKPDPPAPDECCQSGCATCTYDLYLEDLEHHHALLSEAKQKVLALERERAERVPDALWPPEFGPRSAEPADEGTVKDQAKKELEQARAALPPSMRAFLEMEERMKQRQKEVKT